MKIIILPSVNDNKFLPSSRIFCIGTLLYFEHRVELRFQLFLRIALFGKIEKDERQSFPVQEHKELFVMPLVLTYSAKKRKKRKKN